MLTFSAPVVTDLIQKEGLKIPPTAEAVDSFLVPGASGLKINGVPIEISDATIEGLTYRQRLLNDDVRQRPEWRIKHVALSERMRYKERYGAYCRVKRASFSL